MKGVALWVFVKTSPPPYGADLPTLFVLRGELRLRSSRARRAGRVERQTAAAVNVVAAGGIMSTPGLQKNEPTTGPQIDTE